ncbi:hypothetical protein Poly24_11230 [Rosistilla carotiformis]|uniref:Uncharacterized protein n=1 Tax=Rosistilla carotiformis TaxID=2528017 RepID=A0A518JPI8_9BACT|nr:hypothetical protein [Rosistilla carotiformis]QDV67428.1 hypothetical protein Poly24_11230 [Rosistilla carotiformis]
MGPGLQLLAFNSAVDVASQVGNIARGAVQNFADLVKPEASSSEGESAAAVSDSSADQLARIHAALAEHLRQLELPEGTSLQIEVQRDGQVRIQTDAVKRLEIEDAIVQDDSLAAELRQYAQGRSVGDDSYFVHWPPLEPAAMLTS